MSRWFPGRDSSHPRLRGLRTRGACGTSRVAVMAALAVALTLLALEPVEGHGYVTSPAARNYIAYQNAASTKFYNPSSGNGWTTTTPGNPNACGDPFQQTTPLTDFLHKTPVPWRAQATYKKGQIISTSLTIDTNHGGYFSVFVCNSKDPAKLTVGCFHQTPLINTVTKTRRSWIQTTQAQYKTTLQWRLPANFSCPNGCMLMWEFTALQSCIMPCSCSECGDKYCKRINPLNPGSVLPACYDPARPSAKPEFFRNCADVIVV